MNSKHSKTNKIKASFKAKKEVSQSHEYETMSQVQNRYGKGREKSGSDGGKGNEGFSNH